MLEEKNITETINHTIKENNDDFFNLILARLSLVEVDYKNGKKVDPSWHLKNAEHILKALNPQNPLQVMLVAQMAAVHNMQQNLILLSNNSNDMDGRLNYMNSCIKISNLFIQQVNLLNKLQGNNGSKVVFEHVHIHNGGQAIVGMVHPTYPAKEQKK